MKSKGRIVGALVLAVQVPMAAGCSAGASSMHEDPDTAAGRGGAAHVAEAPTLPLAVAQGQGYYGALLQLPHEAVFWASSSNQ